VFPFPQVNLTEQTQRRIATRQVPKRGMLRGGRSAVDIM